MIYDIDITGTENETIRLKAPNGQQFPNPSLTCLLNWFSLDFIYRRGAVAPIRDEVQQNRVVFPSVPTSVHLNQAHWPKHLDCCPPAQTPWPRPPGPGPLAQAPWPRSPSPGPLAQAP